MNCERSVSPNIAEHLAANQFECGPVSDTPNHLTYTNGAPPSHHHQDYIYPANCHLTPPRHSHLTWLLVANYCLPSILRDVTELPAQHPPAPTRQTTGPLAWNEPADGLCRSSPFFGRPTSVWLASGFLDISDSHSPALINSQLGTGFRVSRTLFPGSRAAYQKPGCRSV